jgi:hypothetical protein
MLVVVQRDRLVTMLDIARDDRPKRSRSRARTPAVADIPYLRICATEDGHLRLTGLKTEAVFPATVHEPGVFFIRAAKFREMVSMLPGDDMITIQAGPTELAFGDVHLKYERADVLVYPDPNAAPMHHPGDRQRAAEGQTDELREAHERVERAKERVIQAAESLRSAEADLARLGGEKANTRKTLATLLEKSVSRPSRS